MRAIFKLVLLLCLTVFATPIFSQTIQKAHCTAADTCSFQNPVKAGDTLIAIGRFQFTAPTISDLQNNVWIPLYLNGWNGENGSLWYALNAPAGIETLQFGAVGSDIVLLEYPPATFDQRTATIHNCCTHFVPLGPIVTTAPQELLITWVVNNAPFKPYDPTIPNFNTEDGGTTIVVADQIVAPGSYIATIPQNQIGSWGAAIAGFILTGPPPILTIPFPGCCIVEFPITNAGQVPSCGPADGTCSIQIQICDTQNPPNCLSSQSGVLSLVRTVTLPTPQTQTIIVAKASTP